MRISPLVIVLCIFTLVTTTTPTTTVTTTTPTTTVTTTKPTSTVTTTTPTTTVTTTTPTTTVTTTKPTTTTPTTTVTTPTTSTTVTTPTTTTTTTPSTTVTTTRPTSIVTTTTSTTTTTTQIKVDNCSFYYNYLFGCHAYCADSACVSDIQRSLIGYDMNNGKGSIGKAVSESMIDSVRASCPTGSKNLRNLGFTKSGIKYLHNLDGTGLKQGWVSTVRGACGATVPIKRWKSRYTDNMLYGVDFEWNTWY
ncbi:hypothetical protein PFISCL1PPCAC_5227, partial [Pristionchus fissidentatus]